MTASAGIAGWVEFALLRRTLNRRIGRTGLPAPVVVKLWTAAVAAAGAGWAVKLAIGARNPILGAILILTPYGLVYFGAGTLLGLDEPRQAVGALRRAARR